MTFNTTNIIQEFLSNDPILFLFILTVVLINYIKFLIDQVCFLKAWKEE